MTTAANSLHSAPIAEWGQNGEGASSGLRVVLSEDGPRTDPESLAEDAVAIVARWLTEAHAAERPAEARLADQMRSIIDDPVGVGFTMRFVDRVARHRSDALAAEQLVDLVGNGDLPGFLGLSLIHISEPTRPY